MCILAIGVLALKLWLFCKRFIYYNFYPFATSGFVFTSLSGLVQLTNLVLLVNENCLKDKQNTASHIFIQVESQDLSVEYK